MRSQWISLSTLLLSSIFLTCRGPEGPAGPPGLNGQEELVDPAIQPRVIYTNPPMNSIGPYDDFTYPQVQLRFNKLMNINSIRRALGAEPSGEILLDTGYIVSPTGEYFIVNINFRDYYYGAVQWKIGRTYSITIDTTARDVNGNALRPKFSMLFEPEPYFRVLSIITPGNPTYGLPLSVKFNSRVDSSIFKAVGLKPPVAGQWYLPAYSDSTQILFYASTGYRSATQYKLTIDTSAHDTYGNHLAKQFVGKFTTRGFDVERTDPANGALNFSTTSTVGIWFSTAIDADALRGALTISPPVSGNYTVYNNNTFAFSPAPSFLTNTTYTFTIDTSLTALDGSRLPEPFTFTFTTEDLRIYSNMDGATDIGMRLYALYVCMNEALDTGTVRQSFHITPPVSFVWSIFSRSTCYSLQPTTNLAPNTVYSVTIDTSLRTETQKHLTVPYSFTFNTQPFKVTYTSPPDGRTGVNRYDPVFVYLNADIDSASVRRAFSIDPPVAGYFAVHNDGPNFAFSPLGGFQANTRYTVTISTDLEALGGYNLPAPYSFSFITGN